MPFVLSDYSKSKLDGVHPDLVKVVKRAIEITKVDFRVLEGLRSLDRQRYLKNIGASKTMNSRHLTGHAVDLGVWDGLRQVVVWDWPPYYKVADAMKAAAKELNVPIEWGGDWKNFKDGPHYQLPWKEYPIDDGPDNDSDDTDEAVVGQSDDLGEPDRSSSSTSNSVRTGTRSKRGRSGDDPVNDHGTDEHHPSSSDGQEG